MYAAASPNLLANIHLTIELVGPKSLSDAVHPFDSQQPCRLHLRWPRRLLSVVAECRAPLDSSAKSQDVVLTRRELHQMETPAYVSMVHSTDNRIRIDISFQQRLDLSIKQAIQRRGGKQVQAYVVMALHDDGDISTHTTDQVSRFTNDIFANGAEERLRIAHKESMLQARTGEGYLGMFVSLRHNRHVLTMTRRPRSDLSP
jgi:hypothetical protein